MASLVQGRNDAISQNMAGMKPSVGASFITPLLGV